MTTLEESRVEDPMTPSGTKNFEVVLAGRTWRLLGPESPEVILDSIDESAFARDERMPYWADLWPSSVALAQRLARYGDLEGKRVLELGCGLGLPSLVAAEGGASVLATDYFEEALEFVRCNTKRAGLQVETAFLDWRDPEPLDGFDLVFGADLLYEKRLIDPLVRLLVSDLRATPRVWLADPGRAPIDGLLSRLREIGLAIRPSVETVELDSRRHDISIYEVETEKERR